MQAQFELDSTSTLEKIVESTNVKEGYFGNPKLNKVRKRVKTWRLANSIVLSKRLGSILAIDLGKWPGTKGTMRISHRAGCNLRMHGR